MALLPKKKLKNAIIFRDESITFAQLMLHSNDNDTSAENFGVLRQADVCPIPNGYISNGEIIDAEGLAIIFSQCVSKWKLRGKTVSILVPDALLFVRKINVPVEIKDAHLRDYVNFELGESIHIPIEVPVFDVKRTKKEEEAMLFASDKIEMMKYVDLLRACRVKGERADASPLALLRFYEKNQMIDPNDNYLIFHMNKSSIIVSIFTEGILDLNRYFEAPTEAEFREAFAYEKQLAIQLERQKAMQVKEVDKTEMLEEDLKEANPAEYMRSQALVEEDLNEVLTEEEEESIRQAMASINEFDQGMSAHEEGLVEVSSEADNVTEENDAAEDIVSTEENGAAVDKDSVDEKSENKESVLGDWANHSDDWSTTDASAEKEKTKDALPGQGSLDDILRQLEMGWNIPEEKKEQEKIAVASDGKLLEMDNEANETNTNKEISEWEQFVDSEKEISSESDKSRSAGQEAANPSGDTQDYTGAKEKGFEQWNEIVAESSDEETLEAESAPILDGVSTNEILQDVYFELERLINFYRNSLYSGQDKQLHIVFSGNHAYLNQIKSRIADAVQMDMVNCAQVKIETELNQPIDEEWFEVLGLCIGEV